MFTPPLSVPTHAHKAARSAGLIYVSDQSPGIRREKKSGEFIYLTHSGTRIKDRGTLRRIQALAIPPAWKEVWICPQANGHLQATGRDARGRKQHRYHSSWRTVRDQTKFTRLLELGKLLPEIRKRLDKDLRIKKLCQRKVLATVVKILATGVIRVGNDEYVRANESFGLTTLRDKHACVEGNNLFFVFTGKGRKKHKIRINDSRLARIVRQCRDLPGQELFQYVGDDGKVHDIKSTHVNDYIRQLTGTDFSAKDFRTWAGSLLAVQALKEQAKADLSACKKLSKTIDYVAARLGNTPAICRKSYIHPALLAACEQGNMEALFAHCGRGDSITDEQRLVSFLEKVGRGHGQTQSENGNLLTQLRASLRKSEKKGNKNLRR